MKFNIEVTHLSGFKTNFISSIFKVQNYFLLIKFIYTAKLIH